MLVDQHVPGFCLSLPFHCWDDNHMPPLHLCKVKLRPSCLCNKCWPAEPSPRSLSPLSLNTLSFFGQVQRLSRTTMGTKPLWVFQAVLVCFVCPSGLCYHLPGELFRWRPTNQNAGFPGEDSYSVLPVPHSQMLTEQSLLVSGCVYVALVPLWDTRTKGTEVLCNKWHHIFM
jgi:hypothetical protein